MKLLQLWYSGPLGKLVCEKNRSWKSCARLPLMGISKMSSEACKWREENPEWKRVLVIMMRTGFLHFAAGNPDYHWKEGCGKVQRNKGTVSLDPTRIIDVFLSFNYIFLRYQTSVKPHTHGIYCNKRRRWYFFHNISSPKTMWNKSWRIVLLKWPIIIAVKGYRVRF